MGDLKQMSQTRYFHVAHHLTIGSQSHTDGRVKVTFAACSLEDQFSRAKARRIVDNRLLQKTSSHIRYMNLTDLLSMYAELRKLGLSFPERPEHMRSKHQKKNDFIRSFRPSRDFSIKKNALIERKQQKLLNMFHRVFDAANTTPACERAQPETRFYEGHNVMDALAKADNDLGLVQPGHYTILDNGDPGDFGMPARPAKISVP